MSGLYEMHTDKGTSVTSDFWDWCAMNAEILNYQETLAISEEAARTKFWEDVKAYDPTDFSECINGYTFSEALGNGRFDELRAAYLLSLGRPYTKHFTSSYVIFRDVE